MKTKQMYFRASFGLYRTINLFTVQIQKDKQKKKHCLRHHFMAQTKQTRMKACRLILLNIAKVKSYRK